MVSKNIERVRMRIRVRNQNADPDPQHCPLGSKNFFARSEPIFSVSQMRRGEAGRGGHLQLGAGQGQHPHGAQGHQGDEIAHQPLWQPAQLGENILVVMLILSYQQAEFFS